MALEDELRESLIGAVCSAQFVETPRRSSGVTKSTCKSVELSRKEVAVLMRTGLAVASLDLWNWNRSVFGVVEAVANGRIDQMHGDAQCTTCCAPVAAANAVADRQKRRKFRVQHGKADSLRCRSTLQGLCRSTLRGVTQYSQNMSIQSSLLC